MSTNIQIRGVPERVHREVRRRARLGGTSMSEYLLNLIRKDLEFPTPEEFYARLRKLKPVKLGGSAADLIRAERAERERELARRIDRGRRRVSAARKRS